MRSLNHWIKFLAFEAVFFGLFYHWQATGSEGAGRVVLFVAWFLHVTWFLCAWTLKKEDLHAAFVGDKGWRPAGYWLASGVVDIARVLAFAWVGHFWLAGVIAIACISQESVRQKARAALI